MKNAITTIQIHEDVKEDLDRLKTQKESYEDVIRRLARETEIRKRKNRELLIEGYKEMAEESLKICKEFEALDREVEEKYGR